MITLQINGQSHTIDAPDDMPLLWALRDLVGLTGTKFGCGIAQCGACTVHLDGKAVRSCLLPVGSIGNRAITTIEAVGETPNGAKIQKACSTSRWCNAAIASPARSCRPRRCSTAPPTRMIPISMPRWRATSARCGTYVRIRQAIKNAAKTV